MTARSPTWASLGWSQRAGRVVFPPGALGNLFPCLLQLKDAARNSLIGGLFLFLQSQHTQAKFFSHSRLSGCPSLLPSSTPKDSFDVPGDTWMIQDTFPVSQLADHRKPNSIFKIHPPLLWNGTRGSISRDLDADVWGVGGGHYSACPFPKRPKGHFIISILCHLLTGKTEVPRNTAGSLGE